MREEKGGRRSSPGVGVFDLSVIYVGYRVGMHHVTTKRESPRTGHETQKYVNSFSLFLSPCS